MSDTHAKKHTIHEEHKPGALQEEEFDDEDFS